MFFFRGREGTWDGVLRAPAPVRREEMDFPWAWDLHIAQWTYAFKLPSN